MGLQDLFRTVFCADINIQQRRCVCPQFLFWLTAAFLCIYKQLSRLPSKGMDRIISQRFDTIHRTNGLEQLLLSHVLYQDLIDEDMSKYTLHKYQATVQYRSCPDSREIVLRRMKKDKDNAEYWREAQHDNLVHILLIRRHVNDITFKNALKRLQAVFTGWHRATQHKSVSKTFSGQYYVCT